MKCHLKTVFVGITTALALTRVQALPAFPGAEGYGSTTVGGRGGTVIEVTNTKSTGTGSFRDACGKTYPRIILFRTGGTILLTNDIYITSPYVTIAGQSAPGDGICIRGAALRVQTHDVVVRNLRFRVGDDPNGPNPENRDGIGIDPPSTNSSNIIIDHCSVSWAIDGSIDVYGHEVTVQWCNISEALHNSLHPAGAHSTGLLIGDGVQTTNQSVHHNYFAHDNGRTPLLKGATRTEVVNNVMYNWGTWGGATTSDLEGTGPLAANWNFNYFKAGSNTGSVYPIMLAANTGTNSRFFVDGNTGPRRPTDTGDDWLLVLALGSTSVCRTNSPPVAGAGITTTSAATAYDAVLNGVGAFPREVIDARLIQDVKNGTGKIIDSQTQVGGWPVYNPGTPPADTDHDGMPDSWETAHGLNPNSSADGKTDRDLDGYTNVEEYLNNLMASLIAGPPASGTSYTNSAPGNWSVAGSWTGAQPPAGGSNDTVIVFTNAGAMNNTNDLAGAFKLTQLKNTGANVSLYANSGSSLVLTNTPGSVLPAIINGSLGAFALYSPLTLAEDVTVSASANILLSGNITESAPSALINSGSGTLILSGTNSYTGGTTNSSGTLEVASSGALGAGLLTQRGGILRSTTSCTLTNAIFMGGGNGQTMNVYVLTNSASPGTTLRLLGVITNLTPSQGGSTTNNLTTCGPGTLVISNAAFKGNLTVNSNTLNVAGATTNWGTIVVNTNTIRSTLNVLSNATLANFWQTPTSAAFSLYGDMNVHGTCFLGGTGGAILIYRKGVLNVKPYGFWTNTYNIDVYGIMNVEANGTVDCAGSTSVAGTNATSGIVGLLNVNGTLRSTYVNVNIPSDAQQGGLLNIFSNGVIIARNSISLNSNATVSVAGQLFAPVLNAGKGNLRLSDGTNAGIAQLGYSIGAGTVRITGGSPGMSTLVITNTGITASTNFVLGGPGLYDNNLQLSKDGAGTLLLNNSANFYAGDTRVLGGTLALGYPTLAANSTVTLTGGVLQLNFAATNTVSGLVVNGTTAVAGVHNATTDPGIITGTGGLLVLTGSAPISSTAALTGIALSPATTLSPSFGPNTLSYTASVAYGSLLAVTVTNADLTATNQVTIGGTPLGVMASGVQSSPSQALPANPAVPNVVTVQVTAQDGVTVKTYTVNVTQLPSQTQPHVGTSYDGSTGVLTLNWPLGNLGYRLLAQTNNLDKGVSSDASDWATVPNSTATNTAAISTTNQNQYFHLVYP
jgi:autotransporter-associated beta strand protein